jgi:multidrug efflux system outer membrane protein
MTSSLFPVLFGLASTLVVAGCAISPQPIDTAEHFERARSERAELYGDQAPSKGPLTLADAIARGLKYNFDQRLSLMEQVLQDRQLSLSNLNMLPRLAASAGYTVRDRERASSSISYETRRQSLEPSISEDIERWTGDITFSWSILDFGLSYFQARQQADRSLIAVERRRRVINNMAKEIRSAYWRATSAERLLPRVDEAVEQVKLALASAETISAENLQPAAQTLEYKRDLLQVISQLKRLRADLAVSRAQLCALVNLPIGEPFELETPTQSIEDLPQIDVSVDAMELYGVAFRPELREEAYQQRIDRQGVYREILRMFPGVSLVASTNYDSNSFLTFNQWNELGLRATFNLMGLIQQPSAIAAAEAQETVSKTRRLALSVAVMTQVNIGYRQYQQAIESYQTASALNDVQERLLEVTRNAANLDAASELEGIRRNVQAIAATLERDRSLAEVQTALGNLLLSVGVDPIPASVETTDLDDLTRLVGNSIKRLERGRFSRFIEVSLPSAAEPKPSPGSNSTDRPGQS